MKKDDELVAVIMAVMVLIPGIWSIKYSIIAAVILLSFIIFVGDFFFRFAIRSDAPFNIHGKTSKHSKNHMDEKSERTEEKKPESFSGFCGDQKDKEWFLSRTGDVWMRNQDDLELHGYFLENEKECRRYAIVIHGYTGNADEMCLFSRKFFEMGFHIIAPDLRAHGKSEGKIRGMGWPDRKDILEWIQCILKRTPDAEIILFGISMGGATVMMTAGEPLPPQVKLAIEDCGYSSIWEEFSVQIRKMFHIPAFPFLHMASVIAKLKAGYFFHEASSVKQLKKSRIPILFIHGEQDDFVPFSMMEEVYQAAVCPKQKLVIKDAGHAMASVKGGSFYWETIQKFLQTYL